MDLLLVASQVLIGAVFAVAAFTKLRSRADLRAFASGLVMVPERLRLAAAGAVAAGEAATAALMVIPEIGLVLGGIMLGAFSLVIAVTVRRGERVSCRCFGPSATPLGRLHLVRNALLLLVVAVGGTALAFPGGPPDAAGLAVAIPAGLAGAVVFVAFDDIAGLFTDRTGRV
ncbi:small-conductance mechanosensitive channel [Nonomuraea thailandensis]|uniref:Small-conductance mechanosensitive channel n=1 Tax=Nonomuraea thailandensis TaxID=1188745 RepID=A0A9X2GBS0_9ACTN|nr:MauE/DoxX family redox-associated membrane protein [Nonomuraea thailandensis]MCP2354755.1 small-conductance mechanosensitive channel [Nonomuraea thailandensis]